MGTVITATSHAGGEKPIQAYIVGGGYDDNGAIVYASYLVLRFNDTVKATASPEVGLVLQANSFVGDSAKSGRCLIMRLNTTLFSEDENDLLSWTPAEGVYIEIGTGTQVAAFTDLEVINLSPIPSH